MNENTFHRGRLNVHVHSTQRGFYVLRVLGEMYIGIDSRLIDLTLCCIICSQIKKD